MKQITLWTIHIISLLLTLFFGIIWINRLGLTYNSEGRYFDEINFVVYNASAVWTYGILTLLFGIIALTSWILIRKRRLADKRKRGRGI